MDRISNDTAIQKHEKLIYKIAVSFGFNNYESADLVRQVSLCAISRYADPENRFELRILMSKIMVHQCIFRISNKLFSQNAVRKKPRVLGYYSDYKNSAECNYEDIPLSVRVVYLLSNTIGFTEIEIAEILNITSAKVRDRFNKARYLLTNRGMMYTHR